MVEGDVGAAVDLDAVLVLERRIACVAGADRQRVVEGHVRRGGDPQDTRCTEPDALEAGAPEVDRQVRAR